uniref:Uncharacterized protein n=1 Tax=Populus trichocarpa TaxID=3694 RepID=A0A3N7G7J5_POPTR
MVVGGLAELTRKFMRGLVLCLRRQNFDVVKDIDFHLLWVISAIFVSVCLPRKEIPKVVDSVVVERARGESRRVRISSVYMLGVIGFWFDIYSDFEHFFLPSVFQKDQELSLHPN